MTFGKKASIQTSHLVFADMKANAEKTKRAVSDKAQKSGTEIWILSYFCNGIS
jgi:hypothetical protein